jgi:hypothetical protein
MHFSDFSLPITVLKHIFMDFSIQKIYPENTCIYFMYIFLSGRRVYWLFWALPWDAGKPEENQTGIR